ncbi:unnamed protein product [Discula destructiva]
MRLFINATTLLAALTPATLALDLTTYVSPNTGEAGGGNTFPGVTWPGGIVKLGPDLYDGSDAYSGYDSDGNFTGFSMLHESGTGGAPKYGVVSQMPVLGDIANPLADHNDTRASVDVAEVGYYQAFLGSGITVELAGSERAGFYQYTFPESNETNNVVVDVSHVLSSYRGQGLGQAYLGGNMEVVGGNSSGSYYQGYGSYNNGWNRAPEWTVYFCGYFDPTPATYATFLGNGNTNDSLEQYPAGDNVTSTSRLGVLFTFDEANVTSRVGVSFISTTQACANVNTQIPAGTARETLTTATKDAWNNQVLSKITTSDTNTTNLQLLYTSLYHMNIIPTNKTGENPLWTSSEPYYDDIFTLWDLFRCSTSLFHILRPVAYEEYLRSLIDVWRHVGFLPDARSSFWNGATQGGSNADNVLADAYVKGVRGAVNWTDGLAAMLTDAEVVPPNNNDSRDPSGSTAEGRGALPDWLEYGFITPTYGRSVSRAVEYSVNDFAVYQVASREGLANATAYLERGRNWRNHWDPNVTSLGFSGFVVPRTVDGFTITQDPLACGGCYWGDYYYEALPWEYSFNAHHDIDTLITYSGGEATFLDRLEMMFTPGAYSSGSFDEMIYNPGNEPSFTTPYLFNFLNRQDLTVQYTRRFAQAYYNLGSATGLPGNSDAGAMETWLLWAMIGLYPMTGQTTFLVGSPWFSDLTIDLGEGRVLQITTTGGDDEDSYYVQSLEVNGVAWDKAWVTWDDIFAQGGTLAFVLGPEPVVWSTGALPPSPGTETVAQRRR